MNKLEIGMYIRTKGGIIDKILKLNKSYVKGVSQKDELYAYDIDNIVKASYNIIDILESGDYINGVQVIDKEIDNINEKYLQCGVGDYLICIYNSNEIEDVVTKEQFKAMEYRLGDK